MEPTKQDNIYILPRRQAPVRPGWIILKNLPAQLTPLVGREQEVADACTLLSRPEVRLLTLTGTGGVGKTRLGLEVAARLLEDFADGVFFVSLASIREPDLVLPTLAQALELKETAGWFPLEQLKAFLRDKHLLLLLDNFEQVNSAAPLLVELLQVCPELKLLFTSRLRLRVSGEYVFPVHPLAVPDPKCLPEDETLLEYAAVALFVQRAQAIKPGFQLNSGNTRTIAEICLRLDGLPLAIELAAARLKLLSPQALLARLSHRLQVLTIGVQDAPVRQQTLRNTIQWSYDLLTAEDQRLFRRLAVFVGGCTLEAIEAVCAALPDSVGQVLEGVSSLLDNSLLQQTASTGEELRFMMLETIREYGLEALSTSGEMGTVRQAHVAYYLALAEEAARGLKGQQQAEWLGRLEQEHDNLRATLSWSLVPEQTGLGPEIALRLVVALEEFWIVRGHYSEARAYLEQALAASAGVATSARVRALRAAAEFATDQSDNDRAEALCQESLLLSRQIGDTRGIAASLKLLGWIVLVQGANIATEVPLLEESLALFRELGDKADLAWSLFELADTVSNQGEFRRGLALFEESLALFRELGNKRGIARCFQQSALWLLWARGDQAIIHARLEESRTLYSELGDKDGMAFYCFISGWVAFSQGDTATAHTLVEQSLAHWREMGDRWHATWPITFLGRIKARQGDLSAARTLHEEGLAAARALEDPWPTSYCLEGLAGVVAAQGENVLAARLWGAAESLHELCGIPLMPYDRADYEPAIAAVRTQLGSKAFEAAWAEGRTMTLEQVLNSSGRAAWSTPEAARQPLTTTAKTLPTSPAGLTTREVEVLRLLAQGMTSQQTAERLILSLHTVNAHVRSIYTKLELNSRSALTRYAIEQRLL